MEKLMNIQDDRKNEIIKSAIEKNALCVITRSGADGWQTFKSKIVSGTPHDRIALQSPVDTVGDDQPAFFAGQRLGISFRRGHKKCMFASIVLSHGQTEVNGESMLVLEAQWPQELQELQRRVYYRVQPPGRMVRVRFWKGGVSARANAGESVETFTGALLDLSAGGMRVTTTDVAPDTFVEGESVGCSFIPKPRAETVVLDCVFRHFQIQEDGAVSLGFQFVGMETTERGRAILSDLAGIVTDYQREQARLERRQLATRLPAR